MTERIPAQTFPPAEFIRDELEARGWTQTEFATVLGRPLQFVNELLSGRKAITPDTAISLGKAFSTSAELWVNLEGAYRLSLQREKNAKAGKDASDVELRGRLYSFAPVKDMTKRKWIAPGDSVADLRRELNGFFGVSDVLTEKVSICVAAKKSVSPEDNYATLSPSQLAWACRVRQLAKVVGVAKFDRDALVRNLKVIHRLVAHEGSIRHVPKMLAELGIRFVMVEKLPGSKMDGAALWLTPNDPVIGMSCRYDRIDNFWFVLAHELAHVLHGDSSMDENLVGDGAQSTEEKPEVEQRADRWAANYLVPGEEIQNFIMRVKPLYSKKLIIQFANRIKTHPGVIVGQLQRRKEIDWSHNREMLVKVRDIVTAAAMTDGWGHVPVLR